MMYHKICFCILPLRGAQIAGQEDGVVIKKPGRFVSITRIIIEGGFVKA